MKVALYLHDLAVTSGGGFTYISEIAQSVGELRGGEQHEIIAVGSGAEPPPGWDASSYTSIGVPVGRRVVHSGPAGRIRKAFGLRRHHLDAVTGPWVARRRETVLDRLGVEFVWCLGTSTPTRRLPYAVTVWDLQHRLQPIFPEVSAGGEWARRERALSRALGQAATVIVGTEAGSAEVQHFYGVPESRIRRLPHPTPRWALSAAASPHGAHGGTTVPEPYVLYPAQFWAHKNHVALLHAIAMLRDEHDTRVDVVFVGGDQGNETHVRGVTRELRLENQVHFLGFVAREHLDQLYRGALAMAYTSYFGPENLPPLEAFALGCPVVAADVPGAREQLGDAALLVPPADHRALSSAILSTMSDRGLRDDLIARGHGRAAAYTTETYASEMFRVLDELEPMVRTWR
jgi:glycosyltransferase involved in cell wall biosynthesis